MPELEPLSGLRVVAAAAALDGARWQGDVDLVLRYAPDEAFAVGGTHVEIDDPDAIIVDERGFVGGWCELRDVADHIEWPLPSRRPGLAQGKVAGVPAKVWIPDAGDRCLVVTHAAFGDELADRLGWSG